jgi:hypothetical protein
MRAQQDFKVFCSRVPVQIDFSGNLCYSHATGVVSENFCDFRELFLIHNYMLLATTRALVAKTSI